MTQPKLSKSVLRLASKIFASNGGKAGNPEMKAKAGKAGMRKRWANVPRCPACQRPATPAQREAMKASKHGAQETKVV